MNNQKLDEVVYFLMDKAMKASRKYSIAKFKEEGIDITIDQWVVMRRIYEEQSQTQADLAAATTKDAASITRILDLLHDKNYVRRIVHDEDKRKSKLVLTPKGIQMIEIAYPVVSEIRARGIIDVDPDELQVAKRVLNKIAQNMK